MKNMKKLAAVGLVLCMMLSTAACGGSSSSTTAATQAAENADTQTAAAETQAVATSTGDYPTKPITDIVCTSAGGSTDLYNRLIGTYIEKYLGQGFVVENVTGGAQVIGTTQLANSEPDGYTLGGGWSASFGMRPYLLEVTYDVSDFKFICGVLNQIEACIVRADSEWQTLDELMDYLAEHPETTYGAGDAGSFQYVWSRYVMNQKGVSATFIPHEGDNGALTALMGGAVDFVFAETTSAMSGIKSGEYRVLATCMKERDAAMPDVPCLTELGYECELSHTMSLIMPAGVPQERVDAVYNAVEQMMQDTEFISQCEQAGFSYCFKTGEEIEQEIENMKNILVPMIEAGEFS